MKLWTGEYRKNSSLVVLVAVCLCINDLFWNQTLIVQWKLASCPWCSALCVFWYEIWPGHQPALCTAIALLHPPETRLRGALAPNISTLRKPSKLSSGGQEFNGPNLIVNESRVSSLTDTIMGMKSMMPGSEIILKEKTVRNLLNMFILLILLILWSWSNYSSSIMMMD